MSLQVLDAQSPDDALGYARVYLATGSSPVPNDGKRPLIKGWTGKLPTDDDLPTLFADGRNVGLVNGELSGGMVTVDMDVPEVLEISDLFLPGTLRSGRESTPRAHAWYISPGARTKKWQDAEEPYGVWWFNRRRTATTQVAVAGPEGREYKKKARVAYRDRAEWVAVPVADPGVPREWVDAARDTVAGYRAPSKLGGRFWELSGALMRCGECGRAMEPVDRYYRTRSGKKGVICYYRCREANRRKETCANNKSVRSDAAHPAVWGLVSGLLSDPERLRAGLDAMIEAQRDELRDDPEREAKEWLEKLAALDRKRGGYLDLAAEGLMGREELRAKLAELAEAREAAERRLAAVEGRKERVEAMERDREAVLEHFAGAVPGALDVLSPEERHALYKLLRLEVLAYPDKSLEVSGAILPGGGLHGRGEGDFGLDGGGPDGPVAGAGLGALDLTRTL